MKLDEKNPANQKKSRNKLLITVGIFMLVTCGGVGAYLCLNRPIQPVQLSEQERQILDQKLDTWKEPIAEEMYVAGAKEIRISERELNGLLNHNTDLGKKLKLTLHKGEIYAKIDSDMDPDLPIVGGKNLKARARFLVDSTPGKPSLIVDDLTVWGVSLPNEWIAGVKGKNLLENIFGDDAELSGVKQFSVETGYIRIQLND